MDSMYSVIHEGGHAKYELGIRDDLQYTCLTGGVSMGVHESQSRFYENIIGRSLPFVKAIFPKMQEFFPEQLKHVTAEQMYRAVNKVQPSLIRTEADELTYSLHVMVRYEIEKQLIDGSLEVKDIPEVWNRLYKEYLGVDVRMTGEDVCRIPIGPAVLSGIFHPMPSAVPMVRRCFAIWKRISLYGMKYVQVN